MPTHSRSHSAVVRRPTAARPIDDIHVADLVAFAPHQRRQEPVQPVEIGQRQEHIAAKRLEPAAGIAGAVAQHGAAHRVGEARLEVFEAGRLATDALAGDEADLRRARRQAFQQLWE